MKEFLERSKLIDALALHVPYIIDESNAEFDRGLTAAYNVVCEMEASDVRPERYASWVGGTSLAWDTHCSKCGQACSFYRKTPGGKWKKARFCPHCGAKMEGNDGT